MLSVLVANPKGGCGKTTVATSLAAAFARSGFTTVLADCDRQKSALSWAKRRPTRLPAVLAVNWSKRIAEPPPGTRRLVIDAPAAIRRRAVRDLVREADIIVVPVLPSPFDQATTGRFLRVLDKLKPIRNNKRVIAVVGNRVRPQSATARALDGFLGGLGSDSGARLRDSQVYVKAAAGGLSVFDMASRRAYDLVADWEPLLRIVGRTALDRDG